MSPPNFFHLLTCITVFSRYRNLVVSESDFDFITDDTGKKVTSFKTDSVYDGDRRSIRASKVLSHGKFIDNSSVTSSHTTIESNTTLDYWDVSNERGIMRFQTLRFRKIGNMDYSTCYEVQCNGNGCFRGSAATQRFCYPSVIVTGLPKCGTSAMYELLSRFPEAILLREKENCPYNRQKPHQKYFLTLPRFESVKKNSIIIDGCLDLQRNMLMRKMLRGPQTLYIVMTRNYADMIWSGYNYFCHPDYDGIAHCTSARWVDQTKHTRSREIFHSILQDDVKGLNVTDSFSKSPMKPKICETASLYFSKVIADELWIDTPRTQTLVIASEELESHPETVWGKVSENMKVPLPLKKSELMELIGDFGSIRVNVQLENRSTVHQMERKSVSTTVYRPGHFKISGNLPMLNESRSLLDNCWRSDCVLISQITGYLYPACQSDSLELIRTGTWRSFNEIYQTNKDTYTNPVSFSGVGYNAFAKEKEKTFHLNTDNKYSKSIKINFTSPFTWSLKKH